MLARASVVDRLLTAGAASIFEMEAEEYRSQQVQHNDTCLAVETCSCRLVIGANKIGRGGFATVFDATLDSRVEVAVKRCHHEYQQSQVRQTCLTYAVTCLPS